MEPDRRPPLFTHRMRIRYAECDQQGVVFNAHYLAFYDVAMVELWRARLGGYAAMVAAGADYMIAETHLHYVAGARFDEQLEIDVRVGRIGTSSLVLEPTFRIGDRVCVHGAVRHVFVVPGGRSRPIPDDVRALVEPHAPPAA